MRPLPLALLGTGWQVRGGAASLLENVVLGQATGAGWLQSCQGHSFTLRGPQLRACAPEPQRAAVPRDSLARRARELLSVSGEMLMGEEGEGAAGSCAQSGSRVPLLPRPCDLGDPCPLCASCLICQVETSLPGSPRLQCCDR